MFARGNTKFQEDHKTLSQALVAWGKINNKPTLQKEITEVIDLLKQEMGEVVRIYIPTRKRQYVAVLFKKDPSKVGAYIGPTYVDHIVKLEGARQLKNKPAYWRTKLSNR